MSRITYGTRVNTFTYIEIYPDKRISGLRTSRPTILNTKEEILKSAKDIKRIITGPYIKH